MKEICLQFDGEGCAVEVWFVSKGAFRLDAKQREATKIWRHRQLAKGWNRVTTFRELSMTSNFGCFALLRVQSKRTLKQIIFALFLEILGLKALDITHRVMIC